MKKLLLVFAIVTASSLSAQSKADKIKELMTLTKMTENMDVLLTYFIDNGKKTYPNAAPELWEEFRLEANTAALLEMITPVYDKYFNEKELDDIIAFYRTPSGQSLITKMPQIYIEASTVGEAWGRTLGEKIDKKLKTKTNYSTLPPAR